MQYYHIPIPAIDFRPPVYICRRAVKPFVLDGRLDKEFWAEADFTEPFVDIEGPGKPSVRFPTQVKMLWDDNNLYIGAILEGNEIWAAETERDAIIFNDNDFEIFIDPDSDTQQYYEFEMNALNTIWDLFLTKPYRDMGKPLNCFDIHELRTAVYIEGTINSPDAASRFWSVEVVIPFTSICECAAENRPPVNGEYYRMNFSRVQWLVDVKNGKFQKRMNSHTGEPLPEDNWVWAPTGVINIHYPELWAFVFFSDGSGNDAVYTIPEDERIKWELRKLYYAEHACFAETNHYTQSLDELVSILNRLSPNEHNRSIRPLEYRIETTSHTFELSCPSADGNHIHAIFSDGKTICYSSHLRCK